MSSESADLLWDESIHELKKLVEFEQNVDLIKTPTINEAFHHFSKLYVKYNIVLSNLDKCYESAVQPQKRFDIKTALEVVISRVINLRHLLVKWAPPNPDVISHSNIQSSFSWEYVDLDAAFRELGVSPSRLEAHTPTFMKEDSLQNNRVRRELVARLLREKYGDEARPLEEQECDVQSSARIVSGNVEKSEATVIHLRLHEGAAPDKNAGLSAVKIQAAFRAYTDRKKVTNERNWVSRLIGMKQTGKTDELEQLVASLLEINQNRKQEQVYCQDCYNKDLIRLNDVVKEEEGFQMQAELREERVRWIIEYLVSRNALPDSFEDFYNRRNFVPNDIISYDARKEPSKNRENEGKKAQSKSKGLLEQVEQPSLVGPLQIVASLSQSIGIYEERWQQRNMGPDRIRSQRHDVELAKSSIIRRQVKLELTKVVEEKLQSTLVKMNAIKDIDMKKTEPGEKVMEVKKEKSKTLSGKKEKPLPGSTIAEMKEMGVKEMLHILIQNGLIYTSTGHILNDVIESYETERPKIPRNQQKDRWIPQDPSIFTLKRAVFDYCILSIASEQIKNNLQEHEHIRSFLFYGPEGSGKTLMTQVIASELGALLINLSSSTIGDSFNDREGATKLIHMVFTVAKEKAYAPVVIYIDKCHEFFMARSKREENIDIGTDMQRFQRDLLVYKNQALNSKDRVLVIGCTNKPSQGDLKLLKWRGRNGKPEKQGFFERALYFPRAHHAVRSMMWEQFVRDRMSTHYAKSKPPEINYDALAHLSNGYSAREMKSIVKNVLSTERMKKMSLLPRLEDYFSCILSKRTNNEDEYFLKFTRGITDLDIRWKTLKESPKAGGLTKNKK